MFFICENELDDAVEIAASSTGDLQKGREFIGSFTEVTKN